MPYQVNFDPIDVKLAYDPLSVLQAVRVAFFIESNQFLVFVSDAEGAVTLQSVKALLEERGMSVTAADAERLVARWGDGPAMNLSITRGPTARILASRLAGAASEREQPFAAFDAYIQVSFEDLDKALDDINTLIEIQATLQDETRGWVYLAWNQTFSGPDD